MPLTTAHPKFQINSKMLKTSLQISFAKREVNEETNELQHVSFSLGLWSKVWKYFFRITYLCQYILWHAEKWSKFRKMYLIIDIMTIVIYKKYEQRRGKFCFQLEHLKKGLYCQETCTHVAFSVGWLTECVVLYGSTMVSDTSSHRKT